MLYFRIVKQLKSGGSIGVGLDNNGNPRYVQKNTDCLDFVKADDAQRYLEFCKISFRPIRGSWGLRSFAWRATAMAAKPRKFKECAKCGKALDITFEVEGLSAYEWICGRCDANFPLKGGLEKGARGAAEPAKDKKDDIQWLTKEEITNERARQI